MSRVFFLFDLSNGHPTQERADDHEKQDRDDFIDNEILRVKVEMVPNPDRADDQNEENQDRGEVGLSTLGVEVR